MNKLQLYLVAAFFLFVGYQSVTGYGKFWEFGPHGLPVTALSADGTTYRDGSQIDLASLAIAKAGHEEAMLLGVIGSIVGMFLMLVIWAWWKGIPFRSK